MSGLAARLRSHSADASRHVWIAGSPRSGSTWLMNLLAQAPGAEPVDEPSIGVHLGASVAELSPVPDGIPVRRLVDERAAEQSYFFSPASREAWEPALRRLLIDRLAYGTPADATHLLIKEPVGSVAIDLILATLPEAHLIFLQRDGRDVVDSILSGREDGGWISDALGGAASTVGRVTLARAEAQRWLLRTEMTQRAWEAHPEHLRDLVRYEELRADPEAILSPLAERLGLELDCQAAVAKMAFERIPEDQRGELSFARFATPGMWRERLEPEVVAAVEEIIGPKLSELGYET